MNSRVREDEKHEMIIRKLLKNTDNKRCINCGSLVAHFTILKFEGLSAEAYLRSLECDHLKGSGPQYVCTNFSIFVCTYCSGVHREFTHRIKSISMAKFTPAEVANLQAGGNGRAREIYFKELDPVRNPLPDSSDNDKLRNFIKHVYVERRFTGERAAPVKGQQGDRDDNDTRRPDPRNDRKLEFQSPSREDPGGDRRNNERFSDRARKSDVGGHYNEKRSPGRFEAEKPPRRSYDDREGRRDEKTSSEIARAKPPSRPLSRNSEDDGPPIRSVKDILGDDVPSLRVNTNVRVLPGSIPAPVGLQKEGRSQSLNHLGNGEAAAQAPAVKRVNSESMISLIDFGADPEPVVATANVPDPFASAAANKVASDPFAAPVTSANQSVVDLFAPGPGATPFADPFAAAVPAPAVTDPFASAAPPPTVADPFASAAPVRQVASDPFGFGVQAASGPSGNSSWATFDLNANTAPPEGYPGGFGANAAGPGLTTPFNASSAAWGNNTNSVGNAWSAFDLQAPAPSAPAPASVSVPAPSPLSQQANFFATPAVPTTSAQSFGHVQSGFPPQLQPQPHPQPQPQQTPGSDRLQAPTSVSGRTRREIPQDFFAQPSMFGMATQQDLSFSMGGTQLGAPHFPQGMQQATPQPARTRNPFDDDGPPAPFNMGSLQAALPHVGGPNAGAASPWAQSLPQYPPTGGYGFGNQMARGMVQQNGTPGGFPQGQGFNQGAAYGGPPFYSQTAGSNPFG